MGLVFFIRREEPEPSLSPAKENIGRRRQSTNEEEGSHQAPNLLAHHLGHPRLQKCEKFVI